MRRAVEDGLSFLMSRLNAQCRFDRAIFVFAHMRCGSTALSNVLCSRPDVSGYGEAHVTYASRAALGRLVFNQARRRAWKPGARWMFDKLLHSRLDSDAPEAFFEAKAIFLARAPAESVRSIRKLFESIGRAQFQSDAEAADYYEARLAALARLWARFPPENRVGLTHARLMADPEAALARISATIGFDPPLRNEYSSHGASRARGGGDPLASGKHSRIDVRARSVTAADVPALDLTPEQARRLDAAYTGFESMIAAGA